MIAQILVADDNASITELLQVHLESRGHRVIVVADGYQLAQKAAEHRPHLIITDVQMPGAYGPTVYQILQRDDNTNGIPVIFMTGHSAERVRPLLPKDPKTRLLPKPVDLEVLDLVIKELLPLGGYTP